MMSLKINCQKIKNKLNLMDNKKTIKKMRKIK